MSLTRYKLKDLIEPCEERNSNLKFGLESVKGISIQKTFISTKADMEGVSLSPYFVVKPNDFAYVTVTSRNGGKITLAHNTSDDSFIVSSSYIVFCVKEKAKDLLLADYLFMYFNRPEFDRYARFSSWGSARETFSFEEMCEIEIDLPQLEIQQKFVDIYKALQANLNAFEKGSTDLKLLCDAYIENLRHQMPSQRIGQYLQECNEKNENNAIALFQGINVEHIFTEPKRIAEDSENGNIVRTGQFAFNKVMKDNRTKLPIALREGADCVVSNSYQVFEVVDKEKLLPKYLLLWFNRAETQRYAGFISFGTTRDIFTFGDICEIAIPLPDIEIQKAIVAIYEAYNKRKELCQSLKIQLKELCPVLIQGALKEAREKR